MILHEERVDILKHRLWNFYLLFIAIFIVHDNILLVFLYIYHLSMEWIVATSTEQSCGNNIFLYLFFH